ncbi:nahA [Symbiodinium sp. CCMP2592]|nr:nahA [Symbiodinium sp. CCMP2592]
MRPRARSPKTTPRPGAEDSLEKATETGNEKDKYDHGTRGVAAATLGLGLLGVGLCAVAALKLHSLAAGPYSLSSQKAPKSGHRERRQEGAKPPQMPQDQMRGWEEGSSLTAAQRRFQRAPLPKPSGIGRFKLVPRPQHLEALHSQAQPGGTLQSANTSLWWATRQPTLAAGGEERAALDAFEAALGVSPAVLGTIPIPVGSVVVSIRDSLRSARQSCAELVGYTLLNHVGLELQEDCHTAEWHFVLRWRGRTAVCATRPEGAFRFAATLRQMQLQGAKFSGDGSPSNFLLEDWPHHCWRGLHLDAVRNWMPVPFVKQYIKAMAAYKAKFFHWHLTDDQAWRLYVPSRPKLVEAQRATSPEFYSEDDVKEVVDFAARHFVTVVPVIEMPSHVLAVLSVYPELACHSGPFQVPVSREGIYKELLCVGKASTLQFAADVLTDVAGLFPGRYIHVGGDEAVFDAWQESEHVRAFAGHAGLRNLGPDILEAWFCAVGKILKELGKQPIMWDDHFENRPWCTRLCPNAEEDWIVQAWKMQPPVGDGVAGDPSFPFRSISSSMKVAYLDYPLASIDFNRTLEMLPSTGPRMLGGCATMWTEDSVPNAVGAKVYPRYLGIAERLWGGIVDPRHPRALDEDLWTTAKAHCGPEGLLSTDLGFACGRFEPMESIRSPVFKNATISSSMESFSPAFSEDRAIDTSDESYFWAVAPKAGDYMDVTFRAEDSQHHGLVKGNDASFSAKWLSRLTIKTGSKDRPGDQLLKGMTKVMQWSQDPATGKRQRSWVALCSFDGGICDAPKNVLAKGPVSSIRVLVLENQEKWMTMPTILAEEMTEPELWMRQNASRSSEKWRRKRKYSRTNGTTRQPRQVPSQSHSKWSVLKLEVCVY